MPETFTVTVTRDVTITAGWGVHVMPVHDYDEETDTDRGISEIDVDVVRIAPDTVTVEHGTPLIRPEGAPYGVPVDCFEHVDDLTQDDTHDLRSRWFATEEEARAHAESVRDTWDNPLPWQSFVQV